MTPQLLWYLIIGLLFTVYAVLDGCDLGIGALFPFLAHNEDEKRLLFRAIGPFWDGNEVWLVTGGVGLFAAFPAAYATVFSGFYSALMLVLFALIFRAVSIEFWHRDEKRRRFWNVAFIIGSALPPILLGIGLGNLLAGIPLDIHSDFAGSFWTLVRPFPLAAGLLVFAAVLLQGAAFAALKTSGPCADRSRKLLLRLFSPFLGIFLLSFLWSLLTIPGNGKRWIAWIGVAMVLGSTIMVRRCAFRKKDRLTLIFSSLIWVGLWVVAACLKYPFLVRASNNPGLSLTIADSASSLPALKSMLVIFAVGIPLVVAYTIYAYRVFKGRVS